MAPKTKSTDSDTVELVIADYSTFTLADAASWQIKSLGRQLHKGQSSPNLNVTVADITPKEPPGPQSDAAEGPPRPACVVAPTTGVRLLYLQQAVVIAMDMSPSMFAFQGGGGGGGATLVVERLVPTALRLLEGLLRAAEAPATGGGGGRPPVALLVSVVAAPGREGGGGGGDAAGDEGGGGGGGGGGGAARALVQGCPVAAAADLARLGRRLRRELRAAEEAAAARARRRRRRPSRRRRPAPAAAAGRGGGGGPGALLLGALFALEFLPPAAARQVVLLTDGAAGPLPVQRYDDLTMKLSRLGAAVHAVQLIEEDAKPWSSGTFGFLPDRSGLEHICQLTGGHFFTISSLGEALASNQFIQDTFLWKTAPFFCEHKYSRSPPKQTMMNPSGAANSIVGAAGGTTNIPAGSSNSSTRRAEQLWAYPLSQVSLAQLVELRVVEGFRMESIQIQDTTAAANNATTFTRRRNLNLLFHHHQSKQKVESGTTTAENKKRTICRDKDRDKKAGSVSGGRRKRVCIQFSRVWHSGTDLVYTLDYEEEEGSTYHGTKPPMGSNSEVPHQQNSRGGRVEGEQSELASPKLKGEKTEESTDSYNPAGNTIFLVDEVAQPLVFGSCMVRMEIVGSPDVLILLKAGGSSGGQAAAAPGGAGAAAGAAAAPAVLGGGRAAAAAAWGPLREFVSEIAIVDKMLSHVSKICSQPPEPLLFANAQQRGGAGGSGRDTAAAARGPLSLRCFDALSAARDWPRWLAPVGEAEATIKSAILHEGVRNAQSILAGLAPKFLQQARKELVHAFTNHLDYLPLEENLFVKVPQYGSGEEKYSTGSAPAGFCLVKLAWPSLHLVKVFIRSFGIPGSQREKYRKEIICMLESLPSLVKTEKRVCFRLGGKYLQSKLQHKLAQRQRPLNIGFLDSLTAHSLASSYMKQQSWHWTLLPNASFDDVLNILLVKHIQEGYQVLEMDRAGVLMVKEVKLSTIKDNEGKGNTGDGFTRDLHMLLQYSIYFDHSSQRLKTEILAEPQYEVIEASSGKSLTNKQIQDREIFLMYENDLNTLTKLITFQYLTNLCQFDQDTPRKKEENVIIEQQHQNADFMRSGNGGDISVLVSPCLPVLLEGSPPISEMKLAMFIEIGAENNRANAELHSLLCKALLAQTDAEVQLGNKASGAAEEPDGKEHWYAKACGGKETFLVAHVPSLHQFRAKWFSGEEEENADDVPLDEGDDKQKSSPYLLVTIHKISYDDLVKVDPSFFAATKPHDGTQAPPVHPESQRASSTFEHKIYAEQSAAADASADLGEQAEVQTMEADEEDSSSGGSSSSGKEDHYEKDPKTGCMGPLTEAIAVAHELEGGLRAAHAGAFASAGYLAARAGAGLHPADLRRLVRRCAAARAQVDVTTAQKTAALASKLPQKDNFCPVVDKGTHQEAASKTHTDLEEPSDEKGNKDILSRSSETQKKHGDKRLAQKEPDKLNVFCTYGDHWAKSEFDRLIGSLFQRIEGSNYYVFTGSEVEVARGGFQTINEISILGHDEEFVTEGAEIASLFDLHEEQHPYLGHLPPYGRASGPFQNPSPEYKPGSFHLPSSPVNRHLSENAQTETASSASPLMEAAAEEEARQRFQSFATSYSESSWVLSEAKEEDDMVLPLLDQHKENLALHLQLPPPVLASFALTRIDHSLDEDDEEEDDPSEVPIVLDDTFVSTLVQQAPETLPGNGVGNMKDWGSACYLSIKITTFKNARIVPKLQQRLLDVLEKALSAFTAGIVMRNLQVLGDLSAPILPLLSKSIQALPGSTLTYLKVPVPLVTDGAVYTPKQLPSSFYKREHNESRVGPPVSVAQAFVEAELGKDCTLLPLHRIGRAFVLTAQTSTFKGDVASSEESKNVDARQSTSRTILDSQTIPFWMIAKVSTFSELAEYVTDRRHGDTKSQFSSHTNTLSAGQPNRADNYYIDLCLYHPHTSNIEKLKDSLTNSLVERLKAIGHRVNQMILLHQLFDTHRASELLIPANALHHGYGSKSSNISLRDSFAGQLSPKTNNSAMHHSQSMYSIVDEGIKAVSDHEFMPGCFSCPLQFFKAFGLYERLPAAAAILVLKDSVLSLFIVNNRRNYFVYRDKKERIFYFKLYGTSEIREERDVSMSSELNVPAGFPVEEDQIDQDGYVETLLNSSVRSNTSEPGVGNLTSHVTPAAQVPLSYFLKLEVYGTCPVDDDISVMLVQLIEAKINEEAVSILSGLLRKNPNFKLTPRDLELIKTSGNAAVVVAKFPGWVVNPYVFMRYMRQNVCQSEVMNKVFFKTSAVGGEAQMNARSRSARRFPDHGTEGTIHPAVLGYVRQIFEDPVHPEKDDKAKIDRHDSTTRSPTFFGVVLPELERDLLLKNAGNVDNQRHAYTVKADDFTFFYNSQRSIQSGALASSFSTAGKDLERQIGKGLALIGTTLLSNDGKVIDKLFFSGEVNQDTVLSVCNDPDCMGYQFSLQESEDTLLTPDIPLKLKTGGDKRQLTVNATDVDAVSFRVITTRLLNKEVLYRMIELILNQSLADYILERTLLYTKRNPLCWTVPENQDLINKNLDTSGSKTILQKVDTNLVLNLMKRLMERSLVFSNPSCQRFESNERIPSYMLTEMVHHLQSILPERNKDIFGISSMQPFIFSKSEGFQELPTKDTISFPCLEQKSNEKVWVGLICGVPFFQKGGKKEHIDIDLAPEVAATGQFYDDLEDEDPENGWFSTRENGTRRMICQIFLSDSKQMALFYNYHPSVTVHVHQALCDVLSSARYQRQQLESLVHQKIGLNWHYTKHSAPFDVMDHFHKLPEQLAGHKPKPAVLALESLSSQNYIPQPKHKTSTGLVGGSMDTLVILKEDAGRQAAPASIGSARDRPPESPPAAAAAAVADLNPRQQRGPRRSSPGTPAGAAAAAARGGPPAFPVIAASSGRSSSSVGGRAEGAGAAGVAAGAVGKGVDAATRAQMAARLRARGRPMASAAVGPRTLSAAAVLPGTLGAAPRGPPPPPPPSSGKPPLPGPKSPPPPPQSTPAAVHGGPTGPPRSAAPPAPTTKSPGEDHRAVAARAGAAAAAAGAPPPPWVSPAPEPAPPATHAYGKPQAKLPIVVARSREASNEMSRTSKPVSTDPLGSKRSTFFKDEQKSCLPTTKKHQRKKQPLHGLLQGLGNFTWSSEPSSWLQIDTATSTPAQMLECYNPLKVNLERLAELVTISDAQKALVKFRQHIFWKWTWGYQYIQKMTELQSRLASSAKPKSESSNPAQTSRTAANTSSSEKYDASIPKGEAVPPNSSEPNPRLTGLSDEISSSSKNVKLVSGEPQARRPRPGVANPGGPLRSGGGMSPFLRAQLQKQAMEGRSGPAHHPEKKAAPVDKRIIMSDETSTNSFVRGQDRVSSPSQTLESCDESKEPASETSWGLNSTASIFDIKKALTGSKTFFQAMFPIFPAAPARPTGGEELALHRLTEDYLDGYAARLLRAWGARGLGPAAAVRPGAPPRGGGSGKEGGGGGGGAGGPGGGRRLLRCGFPGANALVVVELAAALRRGGGEGPEAAAAAGTDARARRGLWLSAAATVVDVPAPTPSLATSTDDPWALKDFAEAAVQLLPTSQSFAWPGGKGTARVRAAKELLFWPEGEEEDCAPLPCALGTVSKSFQEELELYSFVVDKLYVYLQQHAASRIAAVEEGKVLPDNSQNEIFSKWLHIALDTIRHNTCPQLNSTSILSLEHLAVPLKETVPDHALLSIEPTARELLLSMNEKPSLYGPMLHPLTSKELGIQSTRPGTEESGILCGGVVFTKTEKGGEIISSLDTADCAFLLSLPQHIQTGQGSRVGAPNNNRDFATSNDHDDTRHLAVIFIRPSSKVAAMQQVAETNNSELPPAWAFPDVAIEQGILAVIDFLRTASVAYCRERLWQRMLRAMDLAAMDLPCKFSITDLDFLLRSGAQDHTPLEHVLRGNEAEKDWTSPLPPSNNPALCWRQLLEGIEARWPYPSLVLYDTNSRCHAIFRCPLPTSEVQDGGGEGQAERASESQDFGSGGPQPGLSLPIQSIWGGSTPLRRRSSTSEVASDPPAPAAARAAPGWHCSDNFCIYACAGPPADGASPPTRGGGGGGASPPPPPPGLGEGALRRALSGRGGEEEEEAATPPAAVLLDLRVLARCAPGREPSPSSPAAAAGGEEGRRRRRRRRAAAAAREFADAAAQWCWDHTLVEELGLPPPSRAPSSASLAAAEEGGGGAAARQRRHQSSLFWLHAQPH